MAGISVITSFENTRLPGSCWFLEPGKVVTAAHVVWDKKNNKLAKVVDFVGSMGGNLQCMPNQMKVYPDYPRAVASRPNAHQYDFDVGVMKIPVRNASFLPIRTVGAGEIDDVVLEICGIDSQTSIKQCLTGRGVREPSLRRVVKYQAMTRDGQSGSPVTVKGVAGVVGIHVFGGSGTGYALVIDAEIAAFIASS